MDWIEVAEDGDHLSVLMNKSMNIWITQNARNMLVRRAIVRF